MERMRRIGAWARLGYAARGLVYVLLGWIALSSGRALSTGEAVQAVDQLPGGKLLIPIVALGLFGYGLYKIYSAILDLDGKGDDAKGWIVRGARVVGGLGYWLLALIAVRQVFGGDGRVEEGEAAGSGGIDQQAANQVSEAAGGDVLLILAGVFVLGAAAGQFYVAYKAKFMDEMPGAPPLVKPAGRIGYAARAIIVATIGYFVIHAGLEGTRLRSFGDVLALFQKNDSLLFELIAAGLLLFGLVSLVMARYRRVPDDDVVDRIRATTD